MGRPFAASRLSAATISPSFHEQARDVIRAEYGDAPLFVMKDPRCTLLQDFWVDVLRSLAITACPVVIMRPWQDVVASLVRRDGTSAESAALVYVAHGLAAADGRDRGASFVTYEQLLDDWRGTTDRIAREQAFTWPIGEAAAAADRQLSARSGIASWQQRGSSSHRRPGGPCMAVVRERSRRSGAGKRRAGIRSRGVLADGRAGRAVVARPRAQATRDRSAARSRVERARQCTGRVSTDGCPVARHAGGLQSGAGRNRRAAKRARRSPGAVPEYGSATAQGTRRTAGSGS